MLRICENLLEMCVFFHFHPSVVSIKAPNDSRISSLNSINIRQFYQKYRKIIAKCKIIKEKCYHLKNNS